MPAVLRAIPYRAWLLGIVLGSLLASLIDPYAWDDWLLEHIPTFFFLVVFVAFDRAAGGRAFSNASWTLIAAFTLLHVLGAHYLYQNVPYDAWSEAIFGRSISDVLGWERNHYDRLVHFAFGLMMVKPATELVARFYDVSIGRNLLVAVPILVTLSTIYELAEWALTLTVDEEMAANYNGQQGDIYDAQKDMGLALLGKLIAAGVIWIRRRRSAESS